MGRFLARNNRFIRKGNRLATDRCKTECCGGADQCPWYWRADICRLGSCPAAIDIYVCSDATCGEGGPVVQDGDVVFWAGHCYRVSTLCKFWTPPQTEPQGECVRRMTPLQVALIVNDPTYSCRLLGCDDPICFPPPDAVYYGLKPCPCAPEGGNYGQYMVACTEYWEAIRSGRRCPIVVLPQGSGCATVDPTNIVTGREVIHLSGADSCCECCADRLSDNFPSPLNCDYFASTNFEKVDGVITRNEPVVCCCTGVEATATIHAEFYNYLRPDLSCGGSRQAPCPVQRSGRAPNGLCSYFIADGTVAPDGTPDVTWTYYDWVAFPEPHYEICEFRPTQKVTTCSLESVFGLTGFLWSAYRDGPCLPGDFCGDGQTRSCKETLRRGCFSYRLDFESGDLLCGGSAKTVGSFRVVIHPGTGCKNGCYAVPKQLPDGGNSPGGGLPNYGLHDIRRFLGEVA